MFREVLVILLHELKLGLRNKRILLAAGIVVLSATLITTGAIKISQNKGVAMLTTFGQMGMAKQDKRKMKRTLRGFMGKRADIVEYRMKTPILLSFVFIMVLIFFPFMIVLLAYDTMSSEVQNGAIRFLLPRARRSSIVLGKFLAHAIWLFALLWVGFLVVVLSGVYALEGPLFSWLREASSLSVLAWVMSLGYLGWTLLASSVVRRPFIGLLIGVVGLLVMGIAGLTQIHAFSPNYYKIEILGPPAMVLQSSVIFVVMAVATVGLAMGILQRRDL